MAIATNDTRQWPLYDVVDFTFGDLTSGTGVKFSEVPDNAVVIGGSLTVLEAWDSGTSATVILGDEDDDDRYTSSAIDLTTLGTTALTVTGFKHTALTDLLAELTEVGAAAAAGQARVVIGYIVTDRANEVQG